MEEVAEEFRIHINHNNKRSKKIKNKYKILVVKLLTCSWFLELTHDANTSFNLPISSIESKKNLTCGKWFKQFQKEAATFPYLPSETL